jgi:osmotically inducible lipoprotein OsmB
MKGIIMRNIARTLVARTFAYAALVAASSIGLGACSGLSTQDKATIGGAAIGAVGGAALSGGSALGTVGGAAVGGVVGHEVGKDKK